MALEAPLRAVDLDAVVFDVGETLVDESRAWTQHAHAVNLSPFTVMATLGALIAEGVDHRHLWSRLDVAPPTNPASIERGDLYSDALHCLAVTQKCGLRLGIAGNQPSAAVRELRQAGVHADLIASSTEWAVAKPAAAFFDRVCAELSLAPERILYVGDRLDNDILPAHASGMRTAHLRRGPWGVHHARLPDARRADIRISSLPELADWLQRTRSSN
ncbi:HAD family hydrolase [Ruania alkalisoli]|uniref:HAD family hydrolase n=1 Tax=Ruania alkalisoli TaxID=2779775 RepID=A0A7M1T0F2_9MICO|nr:HAD family hydrolase [Ruania alkalisoli]